MTRVPLLNELSAIVLERLDIAATWLQDPPGTPTTGYNPTTRVPYVYDDPGTGEREDTRQYSAPIRVPCQVEVNTWLMLQQEFVGDAPDSQIAFVLHHMNLASLGLLSSTGALSIKKGDKISAIEKNGIPGQVVRPLDSPLYIFEVRPRGWGFGPLGHDLQVVYTTTRPATAMGS